MTIIRVVGLFVIVIISASIIKAMGASDFAISIGVSAGVGAYVLSFMD